MNDPWWENIIIFLCDNWWFLVVISILVIALFMEISAIITRRNTILNREKMLEINKPYWVISPRKAKQDFNYSTQYPLHQGIENTLRWYRENNWL